MTIPRASVHSTLRRSLAPGYHVLSKSCHRDRSLRLERARQGWIERDVDSAGHEESSDVLGRDLRWSARLRLVYVLGEDVDAPDTVHTHVVLQEEAVSLLEVERAGIDPVVRLGLEAEPVVAHRDHEVEAVRRAEQGERVEIR